MSRWARAVLALCLASPVLADPTAERSMEELAASMMREAQGQVVEVLVHRDGVPDPERATISWAIAPQPDRSRALWLGLGELQVWFQGGRIVATRGGATVWEGAYEQPLDASDVDAVLPRVPVLALDLALGRASDGVEWLVVQPRGPGRKHVVGRLGDDLIGVETEGVGIVRTVHRHEGDPGWTLEVRRIGDAEMPATPVVEGIGRVKTLAELTGPE